MSCTTSDDSERMSTCNSNTLPPVLCQIQPPLTFTICGKRCHDEYRQCHRNRTRRDISVWMVLIIYVITICVCFIAGFVVAFQPLKYSNHFSLFKQLFVHTDPDYNHHHHHRMSPLHLLKNDPCGPARKCMPKFVHESGNDMHTGETCTILTKDDDLVKSVQIPPREDVTNKNDGTVHYQTHTNTQQPSFSFKDQIQKCKDSVNIIDIIESYQLEQFHRTSSDRAVAICPFHDDHHPSLHIDAAKQIYKCFACNAGGDVIHFVQEYSKLPINHVPKKSELSFIQALQHIQQKFGDGTTMTFSKATHDSTRTPQESIEVIQKKERIFLANTYAALYFSNCLKEIFAGGARYYLRSARGLSSSLLKTMMIGYAPDMYYDHRFASSKGSNGPNSLVNHLLQSGFTSQEILDSGLAVMRKNHSDTSLPTKSTTNINDTSIGEAVWQNSSSLLMDRFRGRIMVPIIDEFGNNVLGFGGRIIPPPESNEIVAPTSTAGISFKAAKYLNSPESVVFEKRKILFNQHLANKAIRTRGKTAPVPPLILVEGYMDAISLCEIGIYNVAATMGTAISSEQLDQASKAAGFRGGKIVLCLDNDNAGTMAVERLCRNGMVEECIKKNVVSIHVARLPKHIKDPADYIEAQRKSGMTVQQVATIFLDEIVDSAVDWTEWYIQTLISGYDRDAPRNAAGSFSDVFERIAEFLATSLPAAERTKVAYEVAGRLSSILANDRNSTEISLSVRIQLESDLIDLASRLSAAKEVLQRRIDATSTDISTTMSQSSATVSSFIRGLGPNSIGQEGKLSKNATKSTIQNPSQPLTSTIRRGTHNDNKLNSSGQTSESLPRRKVQKTRATISRIREPNFVSVTTHFSGFQFRHQSDMDWLGLQNGKFKKSKTNPLVLGQYQQTSIKGSEDTTSPREKQIYFNSAGFNGYQFLTETAINAGYTTNSFKPDTSLNENGLASIVEQDVRCMIESAENTLLKILVNDCAARSVVKNMLTARQAVNFGGDIQWSTSEKRWLFELLVYGVDDVDDACLVDTNRNEFRCFLARHPSAPLGAFSPIVEDPIAIQATLLTSDEVSGELIASDTSDRSEALIALAPTDDKISKQDLLVNVQSSIGTLDMFFEDETNTNDSYIHKDLVVGTKNELAVQETLVSLLWASTSLKSKIIQAKLVSYSNSISTNKMTQAEKIKDPLTFNGQHVFPESTETSAAFLNDEGDGKSQFRNITSSVTAIRNVEEGSDKFDEHQSELLTQLRDTTRTLQALKESSNRIALRLLDESSSTGVEGGISQALQMDLASRLDDHVRDVLQHDLCPEPGINDIPYEIELETMAEEWGDWYDDDYVWTPGESSKLSTMTHLDDHQVESAESDLERETLDEFFERVDQEWRGWDE